MDCRFQSNYGVGRGGGGGGAWDSLHHEARSDVQRFPLEPEVKKE